MTDCPNCGAALTGAYCAACGQKSAPVNPSTGDVLHEAAHEFLNVDGKTLRSIRLLALSPGALTRELFAARRASSVTPLRLFLACSLLYFATAAFTPAAEIQFHCRRLETEPCDVRLVERAAFLGVPRVTFLLVPLFAGMIALVTRGSGHNYPQARPGAVAGGAR